MLLSGVNMGLIARRHGARASPAVQTALDRMSPVALALTRQKVAALDRKASPKRPLRWRELNRSTPTSSPPWSQRPEMGFPLSAA